MSDQRIDEIRIKVCPKCGRTDRFVPFTVRSHFVGGKRCGGVPEDRVYVTIAELDRAKKACNICGYPWPTHAEACAYPGNVRDKESAEGQRDALATALRTIADNGTEGAVEQWFGDIARKTLAGIEAAE